MFQPARLGETYNHGQGVGHGDEIGTTVLGALLLEVAERRGAERVGTRGHAVLVVLETELAGIFADNNDILPAESLEALASNLAERRREVYKVHAREVRGDINVASHGLDVEASTTANLSHCVSEALQVERSRHLHRPKRACWGESCQNRR